MAQKLEPSASKAAASQCHLVSEPATVAGSSTDSLIPEDQPMATESDLPDLTIFPAAPNADQGACDPGAGSGAAPPAPSPGLNGAASGQDLEWTDWDPNPEEKAAHSTE